MLTLGQQSLCKVTAYEACTAGNDVRLNSLGHQENLGRLDRLRVCMSYPLRLAGFAAIEGSPEADISSRSSLRPAKEPIS